MRAPTSRKIMLAKNKTLQTVRLPVGRKTLTYFLTLSLGLTAGISPVYAQTEQQIIYRETYTFCSGTLGKEAAEQTNWFALKRGSLIGRIGFLKVFPYGNPDIGSMVNSIPIGYAQGYSFWSKAVYGLSMLTDEFSFQASILSNPATTIEYVQRLSGINASFEPNKTHLLFLIDSTWYISDQSVAQTNGGVAWEKVSVTPATLTYGTAPLAEGRGAEIPVTGGAVLPTTGTVRAFGVFLREVNGRVRIDNFTIATDTADASTLSTMPQESRTDLCPVESLDGGQTTPPEETTPPGDREDDSPDSGSPNGVEQQIPDEPPPPYLTPEVPAPAAETPHYHPTIPPVSYTFCPSAEEGTGKILRPSLAMQKALKKSGRRTPVNLRNRFIATLLSQKKVPLGSLVNLTKSSYDSSRGVVVVPITRTKKMRAIKLNRATKKMLNEYLAGLPVDNNSQAPLLAALDPATKGLSPTKAACLAEITSTIRRYAKIARINTRLMFVGSRR